MGIYINPPDCTKEEFLMRHGRRIGRNEVRNFDFSNCSQLPVALVDNRIFTAAAVAYDRREAQEFTNPNDVRPVTFYLVDRNVLTEDVVGCNLSQVLNEED